MFNGCAMRANVGSLLQLPQFCTDETLWSLNVLNSNEHAHAAQPAGWLRSIGMFIWI